LRIEIDPNVRVENNETFAGFEDLFGDVDELKVGDWMTVMCDETDLIGDAHVTRIDRDSRLIYLAVNWSSFRRDQPLPAYSIKIWPESAKLL
jgi:hypothetical protein